MRSSRSGWAAELSVVFFAGFLLASMLAAGAWYFALRPRQDAKLQSMETALRQKEAALADCSAVKDQCNEQREKLRAENGEISAKLEEALRGWGRCLRSRTSGGQEQ